MARESPKRHSFQPIKLVFHSAFGNGSAIKCPRVCVCVCAGCGKREKKSQKDTNGAAHTYLCAVYVQERERKSHKTNKRDSPNFPFSSLFFYFWNDVIAKKKLFFFFRFWKVIAYGLTELVRAPLLLQSGNLHQLFTGFYLVFFFVLYFLSLSKEFVTVNWTIYGDPSQW